MLSRRIFFSVAWFLFVTVLSACGSKSGIPAGQLPGPAATLAALPQKGVPEFDHIFVIVEENRSYQDVISNPNAPYINSLLRQYALAVDTAGTAHPSLPNYLQLTGGSTFGVTSDCTPAQCPIKATSIADELERSGKSWKAYLESMPAPCTTIDSGGYAVRHNPFVYYNNIRENAARCSAYDVPFSALAADLDGTTTPNFVWISPNLCHDMHNCDVKTGDEWLKENVGKIIKSSAWQSQNSLLLITWDEDGGDADHRLATLVIAKNVRPGFRSEGNYGHVNLLRTIVEWWHLTPLALQGTAPALLTEFWRR